MRFLDFLLGFICLFGMLSVVRLCSVKLSTIPVQENFQFDNFTESAWNTVKYNKFPPMGGRNIIPTDQRSLFGWNGTEPIVTNTVRLPKSMRFMCYSETGKVQFLENNPAKMFLQYRNKRTKATHEQNQWVLYTDYNHIAILYSCEAKPKELVDGVCPKEHRYVWILAKKTSLTEAENKMAKDMAADVCVTESLKTVDHLRPCN
ncbi:uncharacterized protein LOC133206384 [Saccostrea echinata]|uniref:uncharacterized protein LOC133206384 n=1 Tax=Saccostrea echinata TaxID=191078 RepID=UPI002A7ED8BA|nr:uncharacterized protein LOC133206384 [Saccostrea echinata]